MSAVAVAGVLVLSGCKATTTAGGTAHPAPPASTTSAATPTATTPAAAGGRLPVGPGPRAHYTVQAQPAAGSCHYRYEGGQPLPDLTCTPGAVSPAVTQANLASTICKSGYTSTIRPSSYVTGKEKKANALSYGYTGAMGDAEYDHQISLEIGGDPNDPRNLWIEPPSPDHKAGSGPNNDKDKVENKLHTAVCAHTVTLVQAQTAIATDWTTALAVLHLS
nr:hypothetical protein [Actinacidiphila yanglinensis]